MVGLQILDLPIGVRVPVSQPSFYRPKLDPTHQQQDHDDQYN
jgi:hypothetical protein